MAMLAWWGLLQTTPFGVSVGTAGLEQVLGIV